MGVAGRRAIWPFKPAWDDRLAGGGTVEVRGSSPHVGLAGLARWQAPLFFPLMLLRSGGTHVLGIKNLLRSSGGYVAIDPTPPIG